MNERRTHSRLDALNILSYELLDSKAGFSRRGMGRTLNVSENGLLLEVYAPLERGQSVALTVGFEEDLVSLMAQVVHVEAAGGDRYRAGLELREIDGRARGVFRRYLEAFRAAHPT